MSPARPDDEAPQDTLARFLASDDLADLAIAIENLESRLSLPALDDKTRRDYYTNLSASLLTRFERQGDYNDLERAAEFGELATNCAKPDSRAFCALSNAKRIAFSYTQDAVDINAAVAIGQRAVATAEDRQERVYAGSALGTALNLRYAITKNVADLIESAQYLALAVTNSDGTDPRLSGRLSNLAMTSLLLHSLTGKRSYLDESVTLLAQMSEDGRLPARVRRVVGLNLASALLERFRATGTLDDIIAARDHAVLGAQYTDEQDPLRASILILVSTTQYELFRRTRDCADGMAAAEAARAAAQSSSSSVSTRLNAARRWGLCSMLAHRDSGSGLEGLAAAVRMLREAAWFGLATETREATLESCSGWPSDAAACALTRGQPDLAVELLEEGRNVLWASELELRVDIDVIASQDPLLARELRATKDRLERSLGIASGSMLGVEAGSVVAEERRAAARAWEVLLDKARVLPGFENLRQTPPFAELSRGLPGPVVVLTASGLRCDALIVRPDADQPQVVPLAVTLGELEEHAIALRQTLQDSHLRLRGARGVSRGNTAVLVLLEWLWEKVTAPVLAALVAPNEPLGNRTRLWWYPTGWFTQMPLHASGAYVRLGREADVSEASVPSLVVSSYTNGLARLKRSDSSSSRSLRPLIVGLPNVREGDAELKGVIDEVDQLVALFPPPNGSRVVVSHEATRANVLDSISRHDSIHFAGHGAQDDAHPSASRLVLWDTDLTLGDLARAMPVRGDLAFLSACQTAAGSARLPDESLHLVAGMQFLGFEHVVGTMWSIGDAVAPVVSSLFYTALHRDGGSARNSAYFLDSAIREIRAGNFTDPLAWAPYVHYGP